jgi:hypothetical protein
MNENQLKSPQHDSVRKVLRTGGPALIGVGLILMIIGFASFFGSFSGPGMPNYFWCAFLGMPVLFVGIVMTKWGYLGAAYRYVAGETAPVLKDTANYIGEGIQPGVKAVAKAVTEGIREGQGEQPPKT